MGSSADNAALSRTNSREELKRTRSRLKSFSEHAAVADLTPSNDAAAPGFAGAADLPACREPSVAFQLLCNGGASGDGHAQTAHGISLQGWVRLAPTMGLADFITADHAFDQLADESPDDDRTISAETFARYCERISAKSTPGAAKVGGVRGISAERILEGAMLSAERVRGEGGMRFAQGVASTNTLRICRHVHRCGQQHKN